MKTPFLLLGVLLAISTNAAQADSVSNASLGSVSSTVNLNTFTSWAYYGDTTVASFSPPSTSSPTTDALNLGAFSQFTVNATPGGGILWESPGGTISISYTGGVGGADPGTRASTTTHDYLATAGNGGSFSVSSTLFAPIEQFSLYLINYDTTSNLSVTVGSQVFSLYNNQILPQFTDTGTPSTDGTGHRQGVLTFDLSGAVGDVVTFTDMINLTGVGTATNDSSGLIAVGINAVPEPSAYVMLFGGLGLLAFLSRRKPLANLVR